MKLLVQMGAASSRSGGIWIIWGSKRRRPADKAKQLPVTARTQSLHNAVFRERHIPAAACSIQAADVEMPIPLVVVAAVARSSMSLNFWGRRGETQQKQAHRVPKHCLVIFLVRLHVHGITHTGSGLYIQAAEVKTSRGFSFLLIDFRAFFFWFFFRLVLFCSFFFHAWLTCASVSALLSFWYSS